MSKSILVKVEDAVLTESVNVQREEAAKIISTYADLIRGTDIVTLINKTNDIDKEINTLIDLINVEGDRIIIADNAIDYLHVMSYENLRDRVLKAIAHEINERDLE